MEDKKLSPGKVTACWNRPINMERIMKDRRADPCSLCGGDHQEVSCYKADDPNTWGLEPYCPVCEELLRYSYDAIAYCDCGWVSEGTI